MKWEITNCKLCKRQRMSGSFLCERCLGEKRKKLISKYPEANKDLKNRRIQKRNERIRNAKNDGYHVTEEGKLINPRGRELRTRKNGKTSYIFNYYRSGKGTTQIRADLLAAYCFFGEKLFNENLKLKYKNGNSKDISKKNLLLVEK